MNQTAARKWRIVGGALAVVSALLGLAGGAAYFVDAIVSLAAGFLIARPRPFRIADRTVYGLGRLGVIPYCALFLVALVSHSAAMELALVAVAAGASLRLSMAASEGRWGVAHRG